MLDWIDLPFNYIRKATIIPAEEEHFHHYWVYVWCYLGIAFLFMFTIGFKLLTIYLTIGVGSCFFILFLCF